MKKKILIVALCFIAVIGSLCAVFFNNDELNNSIDTIENVIVNEIEQEDVVVSNEVIEEAENTINAVENAEELKTVETIEEVNNTRSSVSLSFNNNGGGGKERDTLDRVFNFIFVSFIYLCYFFIYYS